VSRFDLAQDGLAHLIALPGITVEARDEIEAATVAKGSTLPMCCIARRAKHASRW